MNMETIYRRQPYLWVSDHSPGLVRASAKSSDVPFLVGLGGVAGITRCHASGPVSSCSATACRALSFQWRAFS